MSEDWYKILELSPNASAEEIKAQYRLLCQAWHPDKFPTDRLKARAEEKMKKINTAYGVLSNPRKRTAYDAERGCTQNTLEQRQRQEQQEAEHKKRRGQQEQQEPQVKGHRRTFQVGVALLVLIGISIVIAYQTPLPKLQRLLGVIYANGYGVAQNNRQEVVWYQKAAYQGDTEAKNRLGLMYATGRGVAKDDLQAVTWYQKAAAQDSAKAQGALAVMYQLGRGVAQNYVEAYAWCIVAANSRDGLSAEGKEIIIRTRNGLRQKMTPAQIAAGEQRAILLRQQIRQGRDK